MSIKLKLDFEITPLGLKLRHGEPCVLLGSCFSDEIGSCFKANGFDALSNPFGTIFHPLPLSRMIQDTLTERAEERIFARNDLYFSWDAAGTVFAFSENALYEQLRVKRVQLGDYLRSAKYLFITFGSAFGYTENNIDEIVANCHKMPANSFEKDLTELQILVDSWSETLAMLSRVNPDLQVVFTVSPVRHIKDGLIENNRSKARLFELIQSLSSPAVHYFPSYEIVMDELRDYRFFKPDGIHPNEQAIQYVWSRLQETVLSEATQLICAEIMSLRRLAAHKTLYADSIEANKFEAYFAKKLSTFLVTHPEAVWNEKP